METKWLCWLYHNQKEEQQVDKTNRCVEEIFGTNDGAQEAQEKKDNARFQIPARPEVRFDVFRAQGKISTINT